MNIAERFGSYMWVWMLRWMIWECKYQLAIGEHCGMGLPYKTDLRKTLASLEAELDRRAING